jgi:hypothetical protein
VRVWLIRVTHGVTRSFELEWRYLYIGLSLEMGRGEGKSRELVGKNAEDPALAGVGDMSASYYLYSRRGLFVRFHTSVTEICGTP